MGEETQEDESGLLTIHDVTRAHAGLYQCTADNGIAPPATAEVQLVVQCECIVRLICRNMHTFLYLSIKTHLCVSTHVYSCVVSGFCINNQHAHLVLGSQTGASERTAVEEGSEQRGWNHYS